MESLRDREEKLRKNRKTTWPCCQPLTQLSVYKRLATIAQQRKAIARISIAAPIPLGLRDFKINF
jgi:hypothetical protein